MSQNISFNREKLRTPRAAAIAGILFSLLLILSLILIRITIPYDPFENGEWLHNNAKNVGLALTLIPFSGIAFLWFMGVVRDRFGEMEDKLVRHGVPWQRVSFPCSFVHFCRDRGKRCPSIWKLTLQSGRG